ncbi:hypothetical protein KXD93_20910 [Mucilaginibacter sp. BJC16-A38]|uniref:hypothetical protein n=1 Tax=Mucilaginibacter phenanthrenivorans TaxID=1234842 RepID=UPI002157CAFA|nr:hypothetical protein [Mucilaginibacter phenanthrenivorans]MCR8560125.1 hypothetical protein [Mucilaginibacter phenanthrenivorans]
MRSLTVLITAGGLLTGLCLAGCKKSVRKTNSITTTSTSTGSVVVSMPPATWQEHWFAHNKLLSRVYYNANLALYFDSGMDTAVVWPRKQLSDAWVYIKKTYGAFGDSTRLYVVMHGIPPNADPIENGYGGGHPSPYYDASHDYRNTIDCGLGVVEWTTPTGDPIREPVHEMGHIVASASYGAVHDVSSSIWGDSKFAEIFMYDVLMNIGRQDEAAAIYQQLSTVQATDPDYNINYPGVAYPGADFFMNWFYPIYSKYGKGAVLARYFNELATNLPHDRSDGLNLGEFVHFFSGAAGVNLSAQAKIAFGDYWNTTALQQLKEAQEDYPKVKYNY